jgi:hypothetical protein
MRDEIEVGCKVQIQVEVDSQPEMGLGWFVFMSRLEIQTRRRDDGSALLVVMVQWLSLKQCRCEVVVVHGLGGAVS